MRASTIVALSLAMTLATTLATTLAIAASGVLPAAAGTGSGVESPGKPATLVTKRGKRIKKHVGKMSWDTMTLKRRHSGAQPLPPRAMQRGLLEPTPTFTWNPPSAIGTPVGGGTRPGGSAPGGGSTIR